LEQGLVTHHIDKQKSKDDKAFSCLLHAFDDNQTEDISLFPNIAMTATLKVPTSSQIFGTFGCITATNSFN